MKTVRYFFLIMGLFLAMAIYSCQKSAGSGGTAPSEENLVVETTPITTNNHVEPAAPGPDFPLTITIKSTMPPSGVKIDVVAHPESTTTNFFTESRNSTAASNSFTIANTPRGVTCLAQITVTSISNSGNKWTGSYRYSAK